ncbi:MAG TPA: ABC transporter permease [Terracidiphilus sp.]
MFASVAQDLRCALRQLRHKPAFTVTAVAVLALGLGANIAVFTLVSGIFLRSLPYADPGRIVQVKLLHPQLYYSMSYANMRQLRDAAGAHVETAAAFDEMPASIVGPGGRLQVVRASVEASMLHMLGVQPLLGRVFLDDESQPGRNNVVVLDEDTWRRLYNSDRNIIGQPLTIKEQAYTIVGVMPRGFAFPFRDDQQIWTPEPLDATARTSMDNALATGGQMYARLPMGMTAAELEANFNRVPPQIAKETTHGETPSKIQVIGYQQSMNERVRKPLWLLYAVVAGIWALACLNVTSLMLARAVARTREQAVRAALGASRIRLVQQSVVESLLLCTLSAVVGLLLAQAATKLLWHQIEHALPMTSAVHTDWRVVAALAALTLITALITGIIPALRAAGRDVRERLQGATTTAAASQNRTREALVIAQLALTLVFLVGAGLFLRTINALRAVPLGFAQQNVLTGGVILNLQPHSALNNGDTSKTPNIVQTTYLPLIDRMKAIPGVQVAALSSVLPMRTEFAVTVTAGIDNHEDAKYEDEPSADGRIASAGLVDALGIPMLRGRFFAESDTASAPPVVVVNQAYAKKYFHEVDPVGHVINMGKGHLKSTRIIGVISDMKQDDVKNPTRPEIYFCLAQMAPGSPLYGITTAFMQVAIRAAVPAGTLRAQFDNALHEVAPDAVTTDVKTMHEAVEDSFGSETLTAHLLQGFAALALMIASVGLYGLLSFTMAQRTREIGVRLALGAARENILSLVLRRALILVAIGLVLGTAMAWFAVRLTHSYLYGVQAHDALTFAAVIAVLALAAFVAAWLPARRAAAVDPILALRSE